MRSPVISLRITSRLNARKDDVMELQLSESQKAVREVARAFAEQEMRPVVMEYDERQ